MVVGSEQRPTLSGSEPRIGRRSLRSISTADAKEGTNCRDER
jgi:hypothetical protein